MEAQRRNIALVQQAQRDATILAEARKRENESMRSSLDIMQRRIVLFDKLNQGMREMDMGLEAVNAARSGGITTEQVLNQRNIGVSASTLRMSGEEVIRNDPALAEITNAVARLGDITLTNSFVRGQQDFNVLNDLQKMKTLNH